jgi:hypothetical protein
MGQTRIVAAHQRCSRATMVATRTRSMISNECIGEVVRQAPHPGAI